MRKLKLPALISIIGLMGSVVFTLYGILGTSQPTESTVRLTTDPPLSQLVPFEAEALTNRPPVRLTLQAVDATGQPLQNARIHLRILTPRSNPWFTTDFPIVEGTELLDLEALAPQGELQIQQTLPIRGTYQLWVQVSPVVANQFNPIQKTLTFSVSENWVKYQNLGLLAAILLVVGLGGGWVIGGPQETQPGEIAPQRVRLLLSGATIVAIAALLAVNLSAEIAQSHLSMPMSHMAKHEPKFSNSGVVQSQGLELRLSGDVRATVGTEASLQAEVINLKTGQPEPGVVFDLQATQLEKDWIAFAATLPAAKGQLAWKQEFFDGAPHSVEITVFPQPGIGRQFTPFQVAREIEVEGVAPPIQRRLIVLAYFTSFVILGLWLGLRLRSWRTSSIRLG